MCARLLLSKVRADPIAELVALERFANVVMETVPGDVFEPREVRLLILAEAKSIGGIHLAVVLE